MAPLLLLDPCSYCAQLNLNGTDYAPYIQNEPSPLAVSRVVDRCTAKLVDEFRHLRANATGPLAEFLE